MARDSRSSGCTKTSSNGDIGMHFQNARNTNAGHSALEYFRDYIGLVLGQCSKGPFTNDPKRTGRVRRKRNIEKTVQS
tara:strand:+ start:632 stop:865 length:234 start_codon:yes stop_codon:yes gene_type:complete